MPGSAASWLAPAPGMTTSSSSLAISTLTTSRFAIKDFDKPYKWYNSIMALRVLWLKSNAPDTWKLLDMLMDHAEVADTEDKMISGVVDFIVKVCKLNFTEREVRHVMGVIDTNAYIIGENPNRDVDIQGLVVTDSYFPSLFLSRVNLVPDHVHHQPQLHRQHRLLLH